MLAHQDKYFIQKNNSSLENKKNELLLALYEKKYHTAHKVFKSILQYVKSIVVLNENSEKLFNQIHLIIKRFSPQIPNQYFIELETDDQSLKNNIISFKKKSNKKIFHVNFQSWDKALGLSKIQKDLIYKTAMTFQLTTGCSNFCRRCNEWALPNVRAHFSFDAIQKILCFMEKQQNDEISLYGASDPLDWEEKKTNQKEQDKTIYDILQFLNTLNLQYSILTKVPRGKENLITTLIKSNANISVSITSKNKNRINKIEKELEHPLSKQHDLDELLIPARLDEDFISIKPSITDGYGAEITPNGAFIIIPTFTSALHPFGHKKISITSKTNFFPIKTTGRDALLVDYFKPIKGYNLKKEIRYLDYLLDVQIESIILDNGHDNLTPPGMRSIKEYFEIFEDKARLQRKQITKTVLKNLKKQFLFEKNYKCLSKQLKWQYLKKIKTHLDLCKEEKCLVTKLLSVSFFLKSISIYVKTCPVKVGIMKFLLKEKIKQINKTVFDIIDGKSLENVLSHTDNNFFDIFQYYIFRLLDKPDDKIIFKFIKTYPPAYDPVSDIFIKEQ